jgi:AcrR family transcriptional regulator
MPASPDPARRLRADARRNHEQVLAAAREIVLREGPSAPLEHVAAEAGVGIGTLYRRFGDRTGLLRAVVLDALARSRAAAEAALADHETGYDALAAYLWAALELRVSAVIPQVLDRLDLQDDELRPARDEGAAVLEAIIARGHDDGTLAPELTFGDVGTLLVRLSRPLPGPLSAEADAELARRHLALALAGMRAGEAALAGPGMSRGELAAGGRSAERP